MEALASVSERLREYTLRIRRATRRYIDGEITFEEMRRLCDENMRWYHSLGTYRGRALADPVAYQQKERERA